MTLVAAILISLCAAMLRGDETAAAPAVSYASWRHSGSIFLTTTPSGADLPAEALLRDFPVLVRLDRDFFDFAQAKSHGEDVRFSTPDGMPLAFQIDDWNAKDGSAAVWVRIPLLKGNDRQEIVMHWGNENANSESSGKAVFNDGNGYLSVWHMNDEAQDEVGTLQTKDTGTQPAAGIIGAARHFPGGAGIFGGDKIAKYPSGGDAHSTEAWFRAEKPNATIIGWGNEGGGRGSKIRMQFRSPPHIHIDSDFSDVNGQATLPMDEWIHVVHTYDRGVGRIYINGKLDAEAKPTLNIKSPARLWIGGWYNNYDFQGDIDEVRVSKVARSADWVKAEYENQKPMQTLVGPIVQSGAAFSVSPAELTVSEGRQAAVSAQAGGAQKVYWILKRDGRETVVAADRFHFTFDAGRVSGDQSATLIFKAIYADEIKTREIPISIKEAIPDPIFTLTAPPAWDGRSAIEVTPQISNSRQMRDAGAGEMHYAWHVADFAVTTEARDGKLLLKRAQNSGKLIVTATIDNGGKPMTQTAEFLVTEPASDAWVQRTPVKDEKPVDNQFYSRDDRNEGTLFYNGVLKDEGESVFLRAYADDKPFANENRKLGADKAYAFTIKLKPGLIRYKIEFGSISGDREKLLNTVSNIICGDAYLINGQSNAEATSFGNADYPFSSPWIRTFGSMEGSPHGANLGGWANASARGKDGVATIGYWGMELARRLVDDEKMPICIINGAVGGTRIDQHQPNAANPEDLETIYGRLLHRVRQARLETGIRGILWHQGENDQGADGPTGGFGYETYRQYFLDMAAGWKRDYPNVQHYYIFQIWPKSCAMGINGSDNRLREVQRELRTAFSHMSIMSTLGIIPAGTCHYPPEGYADMARLICPLVEQNNYGKQFAMSVSPPNLKRAGFSDNKKDEIVMEFDQPMKWDNSLCGQFYLDGQAGKVASGKVSGNKVTLKLASGSSARKLTYLDSKSWSQSTLLKGENGIAALTFCEVPIAGAEAGR
ncbi:MAG TPA: DUF2341 domain-containing protein [Tepidisphaeraceae bacterium]|nr:DUF2341 domain-containing protein [Tepidisphaeraceae bacterium]